MKVAAGATRPVAAQPDLPGGSCRAATTLPAESGQLGTTGSSDLLMREVPLVWFVESLSQNRHSREFASIRGWVVLPTGRLDTA